MDLTSKYYKRNLPHYLPDGYAFFITARLSGTLPKHIVDRLKEAHKKELKKLDSIKDSKLKHDTYKKMQSVNFKIYETHLDKCKYGPTWLKEEKAAIIVKNKMHEFDKELYNLISYTIMPNHIHLVLQPIVKRDSFRLKELRSNSTQLFFPLINIMKKIKGSTARECNLVLGRSGKFWHNESYDHVVRGKDELIRIVKYILNNPVKAKLIDNGDDWGWSYYNSNYFG